VFVASKIIFSETTILIVDFEIHFQTAAISSGTEADTSTEEAF
jgi:hypothetical protein